MNRITNSFPQALQARRLALTHAERRLASLDAALNTIGVTLWQTDDRLRLIDSMGMVVAESYRGRPISEFYRDVYGLSAIASQPVHAHQDALKGQSVTLHCTHMNQQFLMMIEPRRNSEGTIIGTVGLSLRLNQLE